MKLKGNMKYQFNSIVLLTPHPLGVYRIYAQRKINCCSNCHNDHDSSIFLVHTYPFICVVFDYSFYLQYLLYCLFCFHLYSVLDCYHCNNNNDNNNTSNVIIVVMAIFTYALNFTTKIDFKMFILTDFVPVILLLDFTFNTVFSA